MTYTARRYTMQLYSLTVYINCIKFQIKWEKHMNILKQLPLTETTYLILLALRNPGHGYAVMQRVEDMSEGSVRIAAGTMYGALDNLSKQELIQSVKSEDPRRKVFETTKEGLALLQQETIRMEKQIALYQSIMKENGDL